MAALVSCRSVQGLAAMATEITGEVQFTAKDLARALDMDTEFMAVAGRTDLVTTIDC